MTRAGFEPSRGWGAGLAAIPAPVVALLALDFGFLALNAVWAMLELASLAGPRWPLIKIQFDYGLPEISNFVKYLAVGALLLLGTNRAGQRVWWPMAAVFVFLFLDDAFRIHENVSDWIGATFLQEITGPGKTASTVGQLPYYVIVGPVIFGLAALSVKRASGRARTLAWRFFILLCLLAFFSAGIDFLNSYIIERFFPDWVGSIGSMIENGGELIIISLCVWCAILAAQDSPQAQMAGYGAG